MATMTMAIGAKELVERARLGDQIAKSQIGEIRRKAQLGIKQAQAAFELVRRYIEEHPVKAAFGSEHVRALRVLKRAIVTRALPLGPPSRHVDCLALCARHPEAAWGAIVLLADGPLWKPETVAAAGGGIEHPGCQHVFYMGVMYCGSLKKLREILAETPPPVHKFADAGRIIGTARQVQIVRHGGPVQKLSPAAAWELGEDC